MPRVDVCIHTRILAILFYHQQGEVHNFPSTRLYPVCRENRKQRPCSSRGDLHPTAAQHTPAFCSFFRAYLQHILTAIVLQRLKKPDPTRSRAVLPSQSQKGALWVFMCLLASGTLGTCQSPWSFLNEVLWEMRVYLIWSLRGSIRSVCPITHTEGTNVTIPVIPPFCLKTHTHTRILILLSLWGLS